MLQKSSLVLMGSLSHTVGLWRLHEHYHHALSCLQQNASLTSAPRTIFQWNEHWSRECSRDAELHLLQPKREATLPAENPGAQSSLQRGNEMLEDPTPSREPERVPKAISPRSHWRAIFRFPLMATVIK